MEILLNCVDVYYFNNCNLKIGSKYAQNFFFNFGSHTFRGRDDLKKTVKILVLERVEIERLAKYVLPLILKQLSQFIQLLKQKENSLRKTSPNVVED